ncbi:MAG TPA: Fe-S cluster assembly protein SufD [Verrucomicrobiae bacterium]|nr:Fe-S cluster assembly protein SufD [Verrucomicrobiae bacterium]
MGQATANPIPKTTEPHLEKFKEFERAPKQPSWLFPLRKAGMARFAERGFPSLQEEDWRFTNVQPIAALPFEPVLAPATEGLRPEEIRGCAFVDIPAHRLVFVDGHFVRSLSNLVSLPGGVFAGSLAAALSTHSELLEHHLGRYSAESTNPFAALNTAFFQDGAFIYLPAGMDLEMPIHLVFLSRGSKTGNTAHPRNLIVAEKGSRVTVLETCAGVSEAAYFTNSLTEICCGDNAVIEHCKCQDEAASAFHIAGIHSRLGCGSNLIAHSVALGARLSRNDIRTSLAGERGECIQNGLYLTSDDQLADHHMVVEHAAPHCNSHEYYNGILDGRSRGVFHGRILVRQIAQKTDAKQTNKNLLLSDAATADTKPQLEIYADDVKCTHGATVGQLNEESIFYLRARGVGHERARRMLIHAFAGEIIERVRCAPARETLDRLVWDRLEALPRVAAKQ